MSSSESSGTDPSTVCFSVCGEADPGLLSRVIGQFAKRGLVIASLTSRLSGGDLFIDIQMPGLGADVAEIIAASLRQLPPVRRVLTGEKHVAKPLAHVA